MNAVPVASTTPFKDRKTGLILFGALLIVFGVICLLFIPLSLFSLLIASRTAGMMPTSLQVLMPGLISYFVLSVVFTWLGIGSILCRRWSRALILLLSWAWLLTGCGTAVGLITIYPQLLSVHHPGVPEISAAMKTASMWFMFALVSVFYILVPGALILFYRSPHVTATCNARDPVERWTDRVPLPVLAITLMAAYCAGATALMAVCNQMVAPFFGIYLHGIPAVLLFLTYVTANAYASFAIYRLRISGLWTLTVTYVLWLLSSAITMWRMGTAPIYESLHTPAEQLARMKAAGIIDNPTIWIMIAAFSVVYVGCLIYSKRYFKANSA